MTIKENIMEVLRQATCPMAEHEFPFVGTNCSSLSACLRKLRQQGLVTCNRRTGATGKLLKYKEWRIIKNETN